MPSLKAAALTLVMLTHFAAADDDPAVPLRGHVADSKNGGPVEGAVVYVSNAAGQERVVVTDRAGRYSLDVKPGTYDVAFTFGSSRTLDHVSVEPGQPAALDGKVDNSSGEVIVIQEKLAPKVPPKPINFGGRRTPPYSDEAVDKDAWTRAWMVLDISPAGEVTRFKFLRRPGYDLEKIAASEVFRLTFEPARDGTGKAVRTWLVWGIEWPSNVWLVTFLGVRSGMPPMVGFPPHPMSDYVPCKGSGPMLLGSLYPTYRDCSVPDLSRMPNEPWVVKP
jgi:Carboxypeptidase regulatory-like domain